MKAWLLRFLAAGTLLLTSAAARPTPSAPGDLDLAFGGFGAGGVVATGVPNGNLDQNDMALQPDGRIVVAGQSAGSLVVKRFLSNGAPDTAFGDNGQAINGLAGHSVAGTRLALQPDGKIVVGVYVGEYPDGVFLLTRLNRDGALDTGFGVEGWVVTTFWDFDSHLGAVLVQPDGQIVACGQTSNHGGDTDFAVARYNSDGSLDPSFASSGKGAVNLGGVSVCYGLTIQNGGQLVLVGSASPGLGLDHDFAVARLTSSGNLDNSFDGDGKVTTGFGGSEDARAVIVQPDDKIVVAGDDGTHALVARYNTNGSLDGSFDGDGQRSISGLSGQIRDVGLQNDGRIVLLGYHTTPTHDHNFAQYRLFSDGPLDPTFDSDGVKFLDFGGDDRGSALALLPDGRLLAYGSGGAGQVLVRLWPDGAFDEGGRQAFGFPQDPGLGAGSVERAYGMVIQPDSKIVLAGEVANTANTGSNFALARFLPDGQPDAAFGADGRVDFDYFNQEGARAVALQPDGKIVAAGYMHSGAEINFMVARFTITGTLDSHFGLGGFNLMDFLGGDDLATAVAVAPDNKIVVAGSAFNGARSVFGVARFNSDGTVDNSFDLDGKQLYEFAVGPAHQVSAVVVQPDKKIVVAGSVGADFALVRFNEDGSVDSSFGTSGQTLTDMGGTDQLTALLRTTGGAYYAAGTRFVSASGDFALAHYSANGVLVTCQVGVPCLTWPTGKQFVDFSGGDDVATALDLRTDGQLVAAGCSNHQFAWAQVDIYQHIGSPVKAQATTDFAGSDECAQGVRFSGLDKVLLAGYHSFNSDANFALARFQVTTLPLTFLPHKVYLPQITR